MANDIWTKTRLGDLVEIRHGWPFKSELFSEELTGRPIVVNIGNFRYTGGFRFESTTSKEYRGEYPAEYELKPGEILLVMTCQTSGGEILGIPARVPNDGKIYLHNQRLGRVVIRNGAKVDDRFLYWLFLWAEFNRELFVTATGTKILHTAPGRIENFSFQLPPIAEQRRIADILGTLDDKIELNRRTNETLEAMARALFKSWFVDFDPVHAKAAVRRQHPNWSNAQVSRAALPKIAPEIAELFPDRFEDSTLGPIPAGWKVDQIGNAVTAVGGGTPSTTSSEFWTNGEHPFCTPKDMSSLSAPAILNTERHLTDAGLTHVSSGRLPVGAVLLSSRAPIGYLAITEVPLSVNQGIIAMICDGPLPNQYVLHWTRTNMEEIESKANGSTFMEISKRNFRPIQAIIPDRGILDAFQLFAGTGHRRIVENLRQSLDLERIRDALLPRLLTGRIMVG